jgi:hypothetical protein
VREADIASDAPMLSDRVTDAPIPEDGPASASDPLTAFLARGARGGARRRGRGPAALQL